MSKSLYTFALNDLHQRPIDLHQFENKVWLIVNTASRCGFTPQYQGLETLYKRYKQQGFAILATPCNQFGKQESGSANEIAEFCEINYGVSFLVSEKLQVNSAQAHPLWKYLKSEQKGFLGLSRIHWNFTKFLVNRKGEVVHRFAPFTKPEKIAPFIERLLQP